MELNEQIPMFLAVTGTEDEAVAKQFLTLTNNDLEYAVTLYMEQHPPGSLDPSTSGSVEPGNGPSDEDLARRLQEEAYQGSNSVREADASVHRHETLVEDYGWGRPHGGFGGSQIATDRPQDIFGRGRVGVFNQRFDDDETDFYEARDNYKDDSGDDDSDNEYNNDVDYDEDDGDDDDEDIIVIDSDDENDEISTRRAPLSRRRRARDNRMSELTSTQRRLADLFRPPFDIMKKVSLDTAKSLGKEDKKWILVNVQDFSEFACQVMNRDFWSNSQVKRCVKENFIFVQYQHDSPNGINYVNFYHPEGYPHLAILDPLTGERVKKWPEGIVPDPASWLEDVSGFLSEFSLQPDSQNPMVSHDVKFDPGKLTEEQQIEYAMKQLIMDSKGKSEDSAIDIDLDENNEDAFDSDHEENNRTDGNEFNDPWDKILAQDHIEPSTGVTTRIQFRFPNGKRVIHKFALEDEISTIISWLKYLVNNAEAIEYGINGKFAVSNASNREFKLLENLNMSINDANLKNSSILIEQE